MPEAGKERTAARLGQIWFTEDEIEIGPCIWDGKNWVRKWYVKEKYVEYRNDGSWVANVIEWDNSGPNAKPVQIGVYDFE